MEIAGLPLHPLLVHATVVLVPLAAVSAIVFATVPGWRWLTRWPTTVLAVLAVVLAWLTRLSGEALVESRPVLEPLVEDHEELGELLAWVVIPFAALVLLAAWSLAGATALASGRGGRGSRIPAVGRVVPALVVLGALGVLALVVLAGDSGARAVWGSSA